MKEVWIQDSNDGRRYLLYLMDFMEMITLIRIARNVVPTGTELHERLAVVDDQWKNYPICNYEAILEGRMEE